MVRILVINDPDGDRALTSSGFRDLDIVCMEADGVSFGVQIEGPSRSRYLIFDVPGPSPTDPIGDTGGLLPVNAPWTQLSEVDFTDEATGTVRRRKWDLDPAIIGNGRLNRYRRDGGATFSVAQVQEFLSTLHRRALTKQD